MEMDHNHGDAGEAGCPMVMVFHGGHCENILFKTWVARTVWEFVLSCLGIFVVSVLYEALKYLRDYLLNKCLKEESTTGDAHTKNKNTTCHDSSVESASCDRRPLARLMTRSYRERIVGMSHVVQTLLNLVQITIAYLLMLIVMTYNYWLCLAVILGLAVGYFFFGLLRTNTLDAECCN